MGVDDLGVQRQGRELGGRVAALGRRGEVVGLDACGHDDTLPPPTRSWRDPDGHDR